MLVVRHVKHEILAAVVLAAWIVRPIGALNVELLIQTLLRIGLERIPLLEFQFHGYSLGRA